MAAANPQASFLIPGQIWHATQREYYDGTKITTKCTSCGHARTSVWYKNNKPTIIGQTALFRCFNVNCQAIHRLAQKDKENWSRRMSW